MAGKTVRRPVSSPQRTDWLARAICVLALLGIACGAPAETPRAAGGDTQDVAPTVAAAPSLPAVAPAPALAPVPEPAAASAAQYKGIATSRTPDGFYVLGAPEAPVTVADYSDFL